MFVARQVMEAVHGVTIEEADVALQRNEWNPVRAQQQLKVGRHLATFLFSFANSNRCFSPFGVLSWSSCTR